MDDRAVSAPIPALSVPCRLFLGLVAFSIVGLVLTRLTGSDPAWIGPVCALTTLLTGCLVLIGRLVAGMGRQMGLIAAGGVMGGGLVAELVGLYFGMPFGAYQYSARWWPTVGLPGGEFFPLLLPFAWLLVVGSSFLVAARFPLIPPIVGGAVLATAVDLLMEPVMAGRLHYWYWNSPGPLPGGAP